MKLNNKRHKDCYFYIENGQIIEENKNDTSLKIMDDNIQVDENSSMNKNDFYNDLSKYIKNMPDKKTFNKILTFFIIVISFLLILNIFLLFKNIKDESDKSLSLNLNSIENIDYAKEELFFLSDVINNSNINIKNYYDSLYKLTINNNINKSNEEFLKIKKSIKKDLEDANSLKELIDKEIFKEPIDILIKRFENIEELTNEILNSNNSNHIKKYNSHANKEIELASKLINSIISYFNHLNISYTLNDNSIFYQK